jgi:hypothetical protein
MVSIIDANSRATLFAGTPAECEEFIIQWGFRIVADNRSGTALWVA